MPLALDVVLLPPEPLIDDAIALNERLTDSDDLRLSREHTLPHVTLGMAVLDTINDSVPTLERGLAELAFETELLQLTIPMLYVRRESSRDVSGMAIGRTRALDDLHERVMKLIVDAQPIVPVVGSLHMPDGLPQGTGQEPESPRTPDDEERERETLERTLDTLAHYRERSAYDHYFPHVTLGFGVLPPTLEWKPRRYTFETLALVHLGPHCTAQRILAQWPLTPAGRVAKGTLTR